MEQLFERKESDKTSTLVKLQGNPLNYVRSLQSKWESVSGGRELHKGVAVALILNKIPKSVVEDAIRQIIEERQRSLKPNKK